MLTRFCFLLVFIPLSLFSSETVYCIHGFRRKPSCMKKMERAFEENGYETRRWGYPSRERTIQEHADALIVDLKETAQDHPGEPIHFVTHSLGGIIVRCAHNHPECPIEAKEGKAVLIVPPNRGSRFGRCLGKIGPVRKMIGIGATIA